MSMLRHDLGAELRHQLVQTALDLTYPLLGSHERMVLTEQYETMKRFMDNPHLPKDEHE